MKTKPLPYKVNFSPKHLIVKLLVYLLKKLLKKNLFQTKGRLREKQSIFLKNIGKLIAYAYSLEGYELTAGEMYRPPEMQAIYLADGRTKVKYSKHQSRLAFDMLVFINGKWRNDREAYKPLAEYWRSLNKSNVSGYDWNWDLNHFQMN